MSPYLLYPLYLLVFMSGKMSPETTTTLLALRKRKERDEVKQATYTNSTHRRLLVEDNYTHIFVFS